MFGAKGLAQRGKYCRVLYRGELNPLIFLIHGYLTRVNGRVEIIQKGVVGRKRRDKTSIE